MSARQSPALIAFLLLSTATALCAQDPQSLLRKAIALDLETNTRTRYTYFELSHDQNAYKEHVFFGKRRTFDRTALYEYTWIGDRPYGRLVQINGKPLDSDAETQEQKRYDQALAERTGLGIAERVKIDRASLIDVGLNIDPLADPGYSLSEIGKETLAGVATHHIQCIPAPAGTSADHPLGTRHVDLWITDEGAILREAYQVVTDEPTLLRGSHLQLDFQVIDGDVVPLHQSSEAYIFSAARKAIMVISGDNTFSRYRKFSVSTRMFSPDTPDPTTPQQAPPPATLP
jgi:hypothetical protein